MAVARVTESLRDRIAAQLDLNSLRSPGALPPGWYLAELEAEQGITLQFYGPGGSLLVELEARDPTRACFARTERFNVYYTALGGEGAGSDAARTAVLESVVALLRRREKTMLPASRTDTLDPKRVLVREVEVRRGLVREGERAYYLNPYVGCMLSCSFCYARHRADFSRSLEGLAPAPWGTWVDVKVNLPSIVAREVLGLEPGTIRISPIVTDPYQPIERRYRVTRQCLEVIAGTAFEPIVLTRSSLVLEDIPLLMRARSAVGLSVPTDDDGVRGAFEPRTESIAARIETLRQLRVAGLPTFAIVQPMLPLHPERLAELLAPCVDAVRIGPMFEKPRSAAVLTRLGREDALDPRWEAETAAVLGERLRALGVAVNPTEGRWSLLR
jgi:DNA repair photolyase